MRNPFVKVSGKLVYQNPWINVTEDVVIRPDGENTIFGIVRMKAGSTILALDGDYNALLVREYKYAVGRPSLELVSGGINSSETPLDAAKRELLEETGAYTNDWVDLGRLDPFTTLVNSPNYMFLAKSVTFPDIYHPAPDEPLERVILPFSKVIQMVMSSDITHGASCATILKAARMLSL